MNNEKNQNNSIEKIYRTKNSKIKIKIKITNVDEKEYECVDNNDNKNNPNLDFSSYFSPKSKKEKINNNNNINNNNINNNSNNNNENGQNRNININEENKMNLFNFTNKLYLSEEHFNQNKMIKKKKTSQYNLPNLNNFLRLETFNKNDDKKSIHSKFEQNQFINGDEDKKTAKRASCISKDKSNADEKSRKSFAVFLKLKEKNKKPPKVSYINRMIKNFNNSKINNNNIKNSVNLISQRSFNPNENNINNIPK